MRRQIKAKPAGAQPCGVTSATARRILQSLERMSSPLAVSVHTSFKPKFTFVLCYILVAAVLDNRTSKNTFIFPNLQDAKRIPAAAGSPVHSPVSQEYILSVTPVSGDALCKVIYLSLQSMDGINQDRPQAKKKRVSRTYFYV